jgi:signal peptidase I
MSRNKIQALLSGIFIIVVIIFISITGLLFISGNYGIPSVPKAYVVLSGSMEPKVKTGSIIIVLPQPIYLKNDIVTFFIEGDKKYPVTHRITQKLENGTYYGDTTYYTKGDANKSEDTSVLVSQDIVGKVIITIPYLGYLVDFTKKPQGFIFLVVVPATIIIYEETKNIGREISAYFRTVKQNHKYHVSLTYVLIPIIAALFVTLFTVSKSYFSDQEKSVNNNFKASDQFATPTP